MKILLAIIVLLLSGCNVILNKSSIEKSQGTHYIEINGGGFTEEGAFKKALVKYASDLCGKNYEVNNTELASRYQATLPGTYCKTNICVDHYVYKAKIKCDASSPYVVKLKQQHEWIYPTKDISRFKELKSGDGTTRAVNVSNNPPEKVLVNGKDQMVWIYENNVYVVIEKELTVAGGWVTRVLQVRNGAPVIQ